MILSKSLRNPLLHLIWIQEQITTICPALLTNCRLPHLRLVSKFQKMAYGGISGTQPLPNLQLQIKNNCSQMENIAMTLKYIIRITAWEQVLV